MKHTLAAILIVLSLASCRRQGKVAEGVQPFDDMRRLVLEQQVALQERKAPVHKTIILNGKTSEHTYTWNDWSADSMFWDKELAALLAVESKPGWDHIYQKSPGAVVYPPLSALSKEIYLPTDTTLPYRMISIERDSTGHMLGFDFTEVRETPVYRLHREVSFLRNRYLNTRTVQHTIMMGTDTIITNLRLND